MDIVAIASPRELTRFRPGRQGCNRATGCSATLLGDPQYARRTGAPPAAAQDGGVFASRADVSHVWQPFERIRPTRTLVNALSRDLTTANVAVRAMLDADASEGALYGRDPGQLLLFATHGLFLQGADRLSMTIGLDLDTGAGRRTVQTPLGTSTAQRPREDLFGDYLYEQRDPSVFSMLALAGAADTPLARQGQGLILRPDDGFLTAYEAELLSLERTDVVLLVGCETGLGFVPSRTGQPSFGYSSTNTALGFRRALHIAGAKTVVGSLWPVLDRPATQYAQEFIRRWLIDGQARYGAHRAAQLAVLKEARSTRGNGNPLFWAGFVYEGDPGDLP
jgi:hypothetical protein